MNKTAVKIQLDEGAKAPVYSSNQAAGADICACLCNGPLTIMPGKRMLVPTGIHIELPVGYEAQIRPRSGLAAKHGITVLNTPGTIDSDYRGEIMVILINLGDEPFTINHHDRIAQMVIAQHCSAEFEQAVKLDSTERGEGGFGSTGVKG